MNVRKRNIYKAIVVIITLAFILPVSTLTSLETETTTTVSIQPSSQTVEKGETFNVSVYVEPSELIMGARFNFLYYDSSLIHANSVTDGGLFDNHIMFSDGTIDNVAGAITDVFLIAHSDDAVSNPGSFVDISFTAQQEFGISPLDLDGVIITNKTGIPLPLEINDGEVIIGTDTTPPVTTCDLDGIMEGDVYIGNVTVTLNATDDMSGINYTMYSVDRGEWYQYVDPFVVSEDGDHIVWFYSVDNTENTEDTKNETFTIQFPDTTPPMTTCDLDGIMEGGVYITDVTVTLTAIDDMSGVNYTMYSINMGEWYQYVDPFVVSDDGEHTVYFYSVDLAGNIEDLKTESFTIQHPSCSIEIDISGGIGVNAVITNTGDTDITDLEWSIVVDGGFIFYGSEKTGIISSIPAGEEVEIRSIVIGIGQIEILVTAGCIEETAEGFLFLFYIFL